MEEAVVHKIRNKITRAKFGEVFFVSSFPKYDVEYVTKLLAQFEKEGLILQHHGDHKEMPSDDHRMDTAFGSLNVIANLFQTLGKGLKRQDSGKRSDISNASSSAYDIWFLPSNCDKKMTLGSNISLAFINKS